MTEIRPTVAFAIILMNVLCFVIMFVLVFSVDTKFKSFFFFSKKKKKFRGEKNTPAVENELLSFVFGIKLFSSK